MYVKGPWVLQSDGVDAPSFEALAEAAVQALEGIEGTVGMVCGPISTGGAGDSVLNFQVFSAVIEGLGKKGVSLFDQRPYEFGLGKLRKAWEAEGNSGYCMPILEVFYARIFESGRVSQSYFIPGWSSSFGARWERNKFLASGISVTDLTHEQIRMFLGDNHPPEHVEAVMGLLPAT